MITSKTNITTAAYSMSLFRKIFGLKPDQPNEESKSVDRSKYMPELKLPVDERFTLNFKKNGGKFLYCLNLDEVYENLENIIEENDWFDVETLILDPNIKAKFEKTNLKATSKVTDTPLFLTTCENLIANDGSLLISSKQIFEKKLQELPINFIVYATTSQLVENIGEGLRVIKFKNKHKIPTNITTIKHFNSNDEKDFLSYGSSAKNLYLLLLEDL